MKTLFFIGMACLLIACTDNETSQPNSGKDELKKRLDSVHSTQIKDTGNSAGIILLKKIMTHS